MKLKMVPLYLFYIIVAIVLMVSAYAADRGSWLGFWVATIILGVFGADAVFAAVMIYRER